MAMNARRERERVALVSEEAAEWFLRLKDGGASASDHREYLEWLKASPEHIAEALRMGQLYMLLTSVKPVMVRTGVEAGNIVHLPQRDAPHSERTPEQDIDASPEPAVERRLWRRWSVAAAVCAIALAGILGAAVQLGWFDRTIETEASEWRHFTLADGSKVSAGPRTRLRVEFDQSRRLIYQPHGEALFVVAKDPARPFYVDAGLAIVRAVGTEFGVIRKRDEVLVTVSEGSVAVSQAREPSWFRPDESRAPSRHAEQSDAVTVTADEQVLVPKQGRPMIQRVNAAEVLAWARGRLIFRETTVAEAVEEFNRRNRLQIKVLDPAIAERPVFGAFDAGDPESFAAVVAMGAHARVIRESATTIAVGPVGSAIEPAQEINGPGELAPEPGSRSGAPDVTD
jgi:transmembrane sensor